MKKFKRIIALVTVAMFVLSFAAPAAFAADTAATDTAAASAKVIGADVKGTKYEKPAGKLIALGIINGFNDGTIRPDSEVTRAQFAAIIAKELGLGDVTPTATKFKDVPATHWASGAINLAVGKGIIHGYPDGTFRPDQPVTFAEAAVMLVQMIGYGPALKGGSWPATPISLAASAGITKGVSLAANTKTPRGDVIIMAANALTADIMEQTTWGDDNYWSKKEHKNLLTEVFDLKIFNQERDIEDYTWNETMPYVNNVSRFDLGNLKADEVEFAGNSELSSGTYKVVGRNIDPNALVGQDVEVWANTDQKEVYYMAPSDKEEFYVDKINAVEATTAETYTVGSTEYSIHNKIKLDKLGKKFKVLDEATVRYNISGDTTTFAALDVDKVKDANIKFILNDDDIITYMVIDDYYDPETTNFSDQVVKSGYVKEINNDDETIEYYAGSSTTKIYLEDADYVVIRDGYTAALKDIKAGDVINVWTNNDDKYYIFATSTQVKGKVEKVVASDLNNISTYDITIAGKKYDVAPGALFSDDNNKTFDTASGDDLTSVSGKEITAYLDAQGNIKVVSTSEAAESGKLIGIVTKEAKYSAFDDEVKFSIVNKSGQTMNFSFDPSDVDYNAGVAGAVDQEITGAQWVSNLDLDGKNNHLIVIEYKLDSAGKLTKVINRTGDYLSDLTVNTDNTDDVADTIRLNGNTYKVPSDTVIFDFTGTFSNGYSDPLNPGVDQNNAEKKDVKVIKWADIEKKTWVQGYYKPDKDHLDYLVVTAASSTIGSDAQYGVITNFSKVGTKDAIELLNAKGEKQVIVYDGATIGDYIYDRIDGTIKKGDFIRYETNVDNEIDKITVLAHKDGFTDLGSLTAAVLGNLGLDSARLVWVDSTTSDMIIGEAVPANMADNSLDWASAQAANVSVDENTVYYEIFDTTALKKVNGVSSQDYVLAIDTDDDGGVADFVVVVKEKVAHP